MKNYQKILCLLLAICMLTTLYSCSGEVQEPVSEVTETTVETAAETSYFESFEKKDYEGYKFRILSYDIFENFAEDSENGDIVNDTLYRRDNTIAELLNIEFVKQEESNGNVNDIIKKCVTAGEDAYDLVYTSFDSGVSLLSSSVLADLNAMPNLNFDGEHWSALLNESLSFNGKQYFASGDILPTFFYVPNSVVYNMDKLAEYGFDSTPYEDVKNGSWTYDAFYNYIINTERDLDGDGKITIENDFVPFAYTNIALEGFYVSGGNYFTKKDPDKGISVDVIDDRTTSAIEKLKNIFSDSNICLPGQGNDQGTNMIIQRQFFGECRGLFAACSLDTICLSGRGMKDDYMIIPCPKYDEDQPTYYSMINPYVNCAVMIPRTVSDPDRTGLVVEMLAAYGHEYLRPAVYDNMMKNKIARNEESIEMLEIIYSTAISDLGVLNRFKSNSNAIQNYLTGNVNSYISQIEASKNATEADIEEFMEAFAD